MSERDDPTLEEIATLGRGPTYPDWHRGAPVLAREIIALREAHVYLATYVGVSEESARDGLEGHRQDALESQARPFQESGELAAGREGDCTCGIRPDSPRGPNHGPGCPAEVTAETITLLREMLDRAKQQQDKAERAAVESYEKLTQDVREHYPPAFSMILAERDAAIARADEAENKMGAVRAWIQHLPNCAYGAYGMQIQSMPGTAHARRCTCGLTDALDGSGQHV